MSKIRLGLLLILCLGFILGDTKVRAQYKYPETSHHQNFKAIQKDIGQKSVRPFSVHFQEIELLNLRKRINATRCQIVKQLTIHRRVFS